MEELRSYGEGKGLSDSTLSYVDWCRAVYALFEEHKCPKAQQIALDGLKRYRDEQPYSAWLALIAADTERASESWSAVLEQLQLAERALPRADNRDYARCWFEGRTAELWLDLGMTELARPHLEREQELALESQNPQLRKSALANELQLLVHELDFEGLDERERSLAGEEWFEHLPAAARLQTSMAFAVGWLLREQRGVAPPGEAARRLDGILASPDLDDLDRLWALSHRTLCAADAGDWEGAAGFCAELGRGLATTPAICGTGAALDRLTSARLAMEARIAVARSRERADRADVLRPQLEGLETAWRSFLESWSEAPVRQGGLAYLHVSGRQFVLEEMLELDPLVLGEREGAERALAQVLEVQGLSTPVRRLHLPTPSADEMRRSLCGPQSGVLVYVPLRDRTFAFAIDSQGVRQFLLAPSCKLEPIARALAGSAQHAVREGLGLDDAELRTAADAVRRELLPPDLLELVGSWKELLLVGLDDLGYVPFELLTDARGKPLGTSCALTYCPTVPLACALARRAPREPFAEPRARFVLAPTIAPDDASSFPAITLDARASDALVDALGVPARVFAGPDASAARLVDGPGDRADCLFLLAHGLNDPRRERPAGVLLAGDTPETRQLWCDEVEGLSSPPLVVLAACGVGRSVLLKGDGGRGDLAAAFLFAGALTVVLPTTDLELDATLRVAPEILNALAEGRSPAEALRATRERLLGRADAAAALQASLLHVVGCGTEPRLAAPRRSLSKAAWLLVVPLLLGLAATLRRSRRVAASR